MLTSDEYDEICRKALEQSESRSGQPTIPTQTFIDILRSYLVPAGSEQAIVGHNDSDFMVAEGARVMLIRAPHDSEGRALDGNDPQPLAVHPDRVIVIHQLPDDQGP